MSRTSRRISRPLIAAVSVAIVLGVFFTIHKLRNSRADVAKNGTPTVAPAAPTPAAQTPVQPAPQAEPKPIVADKPASPTTEPSHVPAPDADALVTQTPTNPIVPATQPASGNPSVGPSAQARNDLPDLSKRGEAPDVLSAPGSGAALRSAPGLAPAQVSNQPLQDAKAKVDSGDLIASRQLLNDSLISGRLSDADADAARKQIEDINKTLVFSARKFPADPWAGVYQVASGEHLATIAAKNSCSWELLARINGVTPKRLRSGQSIKTFKGPFHAVVYKKLFKMEIYLGAPSGPGSMYVISYPVGLGKDDSTPSGLWLCKPGDKIRNPRYYPPRGGDIIAPDDPKNPLGGYWIALEGQEGQALGKESYGIHGTIDPTSIGRTESMGCIRLRTEDISWVYDFLVDGKSKVMVKD